MRQIFDHAREQSPCVLVIEDLDAMLTTKVRSYFLNELDGLAANSGILTIATTNHPDRIDDAILNRPSRFDVKYAFELPDTKLRRAFIVKWLSKIASNGLNRYEVEFEQDQNTIADVLEAKTVGFSFALMKEL